MRLKVAARFASLDALKPPSESGFGLRRAKRIIRAVKRGPPGGSRMGVNEQTLFARTYSPAPFLLALGVKAGQRATCSVIAPVVRMLIFDDGSTGSRLLS